LRNTLIGVAFGPACPGAGPDRANLLKNRVSSAQSGLRAVIGSFKNHCDAKSLRSDL
jgi:hypothetical protein